MHFWLPTSLLCLLLNAPCIAQAPSTAVDQVLERGRAVPIIALGERHWSVPEHKFLATLIAHSDFPKVFPIIVVESGNALYQDLADRYLSGEAVPPEQLRQIWRNTTVPMAWDSPLYPKLFETLRTINQSLPREKKIRVLLGDPPVDWSRVNSVADFQPYMDRDAFYAQVIKDHCLPKHCLLVYGTEHFQWKDPLASVRPPSKHKNALEHYLLKGGQRSSIEVVFPAFSKNKAFEHLVPPVLMNASSGPLKQLPYGQLGGGRITILKNVNGEMKPVEVGPQDSLATPEVVDWVLYLGPEDKKTEAVPGIYNDRAYIKELYRRAKIVGDAFGFDLTSDVKEVDPDAKH